MNKIYANAEAPIGDIKMIRIFKSQSTKAPATEVFDYVLYEDVKFILSKLGKVHEVFAKSSQYENSIISFKHAEKGISHIALNFYKKNTAPTFRVELVGTSGVAEYDSDKAVNVFTNTPLEKDYFCSFEQEKEFANKDNDQNVIAVIQAIKKSIENRIPVIVGRG